MVISPVRGEDNRHPSIPFINTAKESPETTETHSTLTFLSDQQKVYKSYQFDLKSFKSDHQTVWKKTLTTMTLICNIFIFILSSF